MASSTRRSFLQSSMLVGGALALGLPGCSRGRNGSGPEPLRLLVLGGTSLIGPHLIHFARERGHHVTIFNRGRTEPTTRQEAFEGVERLTGDRSGDLSALEGRAWDVVIDNSASLPRWVRATATLLKDAAGMYLFTSSISAYASAAETGMDETAPVGTLSNPDDAELDDPRRITGENYGPLKALCEEEARAAFGDRACIVRPGLIVGPGDPSDRFTYWPVRIERGGEVLAPGTPEDPVQFVDVRDLARWYVHLAEQRTAGVFNATGPLEPLGIGAMLEGIRGAIGSDATFTWADAAFLEEQGVQAWTQMTVWVPPDGEYAGFAAVDCSRANAAGLTYMPLADTARDTLAWYRTLPEERRANPRAGLDAEREAEVLRAWHARGETND